MRLDLCFGNQELCSIEKRLEHQYDYTERNHSGASQRHSGSGAGDLDYRGSRFIIAREKQMDFQKDLKVDGGLRDKKETTMVSGVWT